MFACSWLDVCALTFTLFCIPLRVTNTWELIKICIWFDFGLYARQMRVKIIDLYFLAISSLSLSFSPCVAVALIKCSLTGRIRFGVKGNFLICIFHFVLLSFGWFFYSFYLNTKYCSKLPTFFFFFFRNSFFFLEHMDLKSTRTFFLFFSCCRLVGNWRRRDNDSIYSLNIFWYNIMHAYALESRTGLTQWKTNLTFKLNSIFFLFLRRSVYCLMAKLIICEWKRWYRPQNLCSFINLPSIDLRMGLYKLQLVLVMMIPISMFSGFLVLLWLSTGWKPNERRKKIMLTAF